ncbi:MAG: outer membrane protein assembly factor BamA [Bacteroidota bacterium]
MIKKTIASFIVQICSTLLIGQTADIRPVNYSQPKEFEIGEIKITGAETADQKTILAMAGFQQGDRIRIPGPETSRAIKNLMKQGIFYDVQIFKETIIGDVVNLEIKVKERPRLGAHSFKGVKKSRHDDLNSAVNNYLIKGMIVTEHEKTNAINAIKKYFIEKGFADVNVMAHEEPNFSDNSMRLVLNIKKGKKIKVAKINVIGNEEIKNKKLKKLIPTKAKKRLFASSKFIRTEWEEGKKNIIQYYNTKGFLDATILNDTIYRNNQGEFICQLNISEGKQYFFGNITFEGNNKYTDAQLLEVLKIKKGEIYDAQKLEERLHFSQTNDDLTGLYSDDGHLFFSVQKEVTAIRNDTVDLKIRLYEGPLATVNKVVIKGNTRTNEHVIRRELRTQPGMKFSRADLIRSQRAIANLGFFDPEKITINTPVNPEESTVDIEYNVEEKNSDQLEMSVAYGGPDVGITGTVGVTFNNFSLRNLTDRSTWNPLPMGDGQMLSLRAQSNGKAYQSYNIAFTEPWLGGKKPNAFSFATFYTRNTNGLNNTSDAFSSISTLGVTVSLGTRLKWPDDNFVSTTSLNLRKYNLNNYSDGLFKSDDGQAVTDGDFYNINIQQTIARSTIDNPMFPTSGSKIALTAQLTPPFSLFSNKDHANLSANERFRFLEYHKVRLDAEWYTSLGKKLVLKMGAKFGYVGAYNKNIGTSPFERFLLGGDMFSNNSNSILGTDNITMRGYDLEDFENNIVDGEIVATPLYNKFTLEMRYLVSSSPGIYALAFAEAGNSYRNFDSYNPFDLKRSTGLGLRVQLPMFGTLGFDYGIGFDKVGATTFGQMGRVSLVMGFEPE